MRIGLLYIPERKRFILSESDGMRNNPAQPEHGVEVDVSYFISKVKRSKGCAHTGGPFDLQGHEQGNMLRAQQHSVMLAITAAACTVRGSYYTHSIGGGPSRSVIASW